MLLLGNGNTNTAAYGLCAEGAAVAVLGNVHATACCMAIKGFGTQNACADAAAGGMQIEGCRITAFQFDRTAGVIDFTSLATNNVY